MSPTFYAVRALPGVEDETVLLKRARLMYEFLTQAMPQTELMTHRPGAYVPLSETLDGCEAILAGILDDVAEGALFYRGGIEH